MRSRTSSPTHWEDEVAQCFNPVFPPDKNPETVIAWIRDHVTRPKQVRGTLRLAHLPPQATARVCPKRSFTSYQEGTTTDRDKAKAPALQRVFRIVVTLWRLRLSASQPHEFRYLRPLFCYTLPVRRSLSVPLGPSRRNILMAAHRLR